MSQRNARAREEEDALIGKNKSRKSKGGSKCILEICCMHMSKDQ